jgi:phage terminase large subunit-like protein
MPPGRTNWRSDGLTTFDVCGLLRLGSIRSRSSTTPRPVALLKKLMADPSTLTRAGTTPMRASVAGVYRSP